jgi:hypothetical protein
MEQDQNQNKIWLFRSVAEDSWFVVSCDKPLGLTPCGVWISNLTTFSAVLMSRRVFGLGISTICIEISFFGSPYVSPVKISVFPHLSPCVSRVMFQEFRKFEHSSYWPIEHISDVLSDSGMGLWDWNGLNNECGGEYNGNECNKTKLHIWMDDGNRGERGKCRQREWRNWLCAAFRSS